MLRVAIVGLGPKGMFALERLLHHAADLEGCVQIVVDAFEPHPVPGAGPIYDPGQPSYLRMNFAADVVDMWSPTSSVVPCDERPPFAAWRDGQSAGDRGDYPPRALVGRYLADGLASILRHAPPNTTVRLLSERVRTVRSHRRGWEVIGAEGSHGRYDELLIATGHERSWDGGLATDWRHAAVLVPSVFPVTRWLSRERVAAGATVAVRGFALSFIDAALALTEGRGGRFEPVDDAARLRYSPGGADVGVIVPFSRTGRPMLAKPGPGLAAALPALGGIADEGRERVLRLPEGFEVQRDLVAILAATAHANLLAAGDRPTIHGADSAVAWLSGAAGGGPAASDCGPAEELKRSLAVGAGRSAPDLPWALGHTWRTLYPALVCRLGGDGLTARQWPSFRRLACELERVAFGPPACNAAKLLALIDAGTIDLTHVRGARLTSRGARTWVRSDRGERAVEAVIDAVLPGPGAGGELLRGLIEDGHVRVLAERRGLDVAADGGCRGADGATSAGLSAIGRPTEDAVIGNDTLSRTLHPLADHWARKVVQRCHQEPSELLGGVGRENVA